MPGPYSDNLYTSLDSDPEEDHDTTYDALSPTDGYFRSQESSPTHAHETPYVPNVMVNDPRLEHRTKEEAEEAEAARYGTRTHVEGSPWQNRRGIEDDGPSMLADAAQASSSRPLLQRIPSDAPPAYSPPSPTSPALVQPGTGYQTFTPSSSSFSTPGNNIMGPPEETNRLLPRQPESMGGEAGSPATARPGLTRWEAFREEWKDARWRTPRRKLRIVLGAVLILTILISLLGCLFSFGGGESNGKVRLSFHAHETMSTLLTLAKGPRLPESPIRKPSTSPGDLKWIPSKQCHPLPNPAHAYKSSANLGFISTNNLSIYQKIEDEDKHIPSGRTPHISGNVVLRPVDGKSAGRMELEALANHKDLSMKVDMNQLEQSLVVRTPRTVEWHEEGDPCIQLRITVYVPFESTLESLSVEVVHLNIDLLPDLDLKLENEAFLVSVSGYITAPSASHLLYNLDSRKIWVETVSGDIKGVYPLYDLLGLHTASGTIETAVSPQPVSDTDPKPAKLDVASISGDLRVRGVPHGEAPARDYVVAFDTTSGTVEADVAISSEGKFRSESADFKLKVWPFLEEGQEMTFDTSTRSGTTKLEIFEPTWIEKGKLKHRDERGQSKFPFGHLNSRHSSISGTIDLVYPSSWTGHFEAETISGTQRFRGEGLRTGTKAGMFPRLLTGRKGDGDSVLKVNTVSGDQKFLVGSE